MVDEIRMAPGDTPPKAGPADGRYYRDLALVATASLTGALNAVLIVIVSLFLMPEIYQAISVGRENHEQLLENRRLLDEHARRLKRLLDDVEKGMKVRPKG